MKNTAARMSQSKELSEMAEIMKALLVDRERREQELQDKRDSEQLRNMQTHLQIHKIIERGVAMWPITEREGGGWSCNIHIIRVSSYLPCHEDSQAG